MSYCVLCVTADEATTCFSIVTAAFATDVTRAVLIFPRRFSSLELFLYHFHIDMTTVCVCLLACASVSVNVRVLRMEHATFACVFAFVSNACGCVSVRGFVCVIFCVSVWWLQLLCALL